jgi:hypothetical protein
MDKGKLDDIDTHTRSLDGKAGFGCVIFAALERSFGLDTCPNNDNRITLSSNTFPCQKERVYQASPTVNHTNVNTN